MDISQRKAIGQLSIIDAKNHILLKTVEVIGIHY